MEGTTQSDRLSTATLYASAIAIVSGLYAILASTGGMGATAGGWLVLLVGVVASVHGIVLLTPASARLGALSGPLMIAYALVMLFARAVSPMGTDVMGPTGGMGPGMMDGWMGSGMMDGWMGFGGGGLGMVGLAVLLLVSGILMTVRSADGATLWTDEAS